MTVPMDGDAIDTEICDALALGARRRAFELMAVHYRPFLVTFCGWTLRDQVKAEDVAQHTLLKAFKSIDGLREPSKIRAWVRQIAYNLCIDDIRGNRREREYAQQGDPVVEVEAPDAVVPASMRALHECLDALPAEKRAAVVARYFAGMAYDELAAATGERPDAVRRRVARAMPLLLDCLKKKGVAP